MMNGHLRGASDALTCFQDGFAHALFEPGGTMAAPAEIVALTRQPGFAVYRNTVVKGCIDALHLNYPTVERLVGDEWFRAAATLYVRAHLPADPALSHYGRDFEAFLATFEPARELPYLPGVARLDRLWTEVHAAGDEACVDAIAIADLDAGTLARLALTPHLAARWAWFDTLPVHTIWRRNRASGPIDDSEIDWRGEGALLVRPQDTVRSIVLNAGGYAFLDVCAAGGAVAEAGIAALAADPAADLATLFAELLAAGAFGRMTLRDPLIEESNP